MKEKKPLTYYLPIKCSVLNIVVLEALRDEVT